LAIFASGETIGVAHGGTGLATVGANQLLTGHNSSSTGALTSESNLTFDGTTLATTAFTATGNVSLDGGTFIFNESGADKDFRIEGDTSVNLFISDASTDRIGIGTATPSHLLDIEGVGHAATCFVSADLCATTKVVAPALCIGSEYVLPTSDGSAGQLMCTNGSGALAFATAPSSGISWDGSTANGVATYKDADEATVEANLRFDGSKLEIGAAATVSSSADGFVINDGANAGMTIYSTGTSSGQMKLSLTNAEGADAGAALVYSNSADALIFNVNGATERMRIDSAGKVGIGNTAPSSYMNSVDGVIVGDTGDATSEIVIASSGVGELNFTDTADTTNQASIFYTHSSANFDFKTTQSGGLFKFSPDTGGSVLMQIGDASSNARVGIGTTSPSALLHASQTTSGVYTAKFENNQLDGPTVWINHTGTTSTTNPVLAVSGAGTDALQVKSNGGFFLSRQGTGSGASDTGWYMTGAGGTLFGAAGSVVQYLSMSNTGGILGFRYNDTYAGQVSIGTSSASYQSASDYRLKENIVDLINATDRVAQLKPRRFNWKVDPDVVTDGFIAHEVESIVPEAVSGTKDERRTIENVILAADGTKIVKNVSEADWEEGKTDGKYPIDSTWKASHEVDWYQSMDNAKLVPVLTAAVQELTVRLEAAEAEIAILKG
jgi:hypothetical protein